MISKLLRVPRWAEGKLPAGKVIRFDTIIAYCEGINMIILTAIKDKITNIGEDNIDCSSMLQR